MDQLHDAAPKTRLYSPTRKKYGTASKGAIQLCEPAVKDNFTRSFTEADIDNIKWYPPVPAKLEEIEGKILDKVKAAQ